MTKTLLWTRLLLLCCLVVYGIAQSSDYYTILGVSRNVDDKGLKKACKLQNRYPWQFIGRCECWFLLVGNLDRVSPFSHSRTKQFWVLLADTSLSPLPLNSKKQKLSKQYREWFPLSKYSPLDWKNPPTSIIRSRQEPFWTSRDEIPRNLSFLRSFIRSRETSNLRSTRWSWVETTRKQWWSRSRRRRSFRRFQESVRIRWTRWWWTRTKKRSKYVGRDWSRFEIYVRRR